MASLCVLVEDPLYKKYITKSKRSLGAQKLKLPLNSWPVPNATCLSCLAQNICTAKRILERLQFRLHHCLSNFGWSEFKANFLLFGIYMAWVFFHLESIGVR